MALELTTTRRRTPLSETTFVTRQPGYIQTYIGETEVDKVPPYRGTYIGQVSPLTPAQRSGGPRCGATSDDTIEWRRRDGRPGVRYGDYSPGPEWDDYRVVCVPRAPQRYGRATAQARLRRRHGRLTRGLAETTFVTRQPGYIQTYIGGLGQHRYDREGRAMGARMYDAAGRAIAGYSDNREMMGFGSLDATISVRELQQKLRRAGVCNPGPGGAAMAIDGKFGPITSATLTRFATMQGHGPGIDHQIYVPGEEVGGAYAAFRATSIRLDAELLAKLNRESAGQIDACAGGARASSGGNGEPLPNGGGYTTASVFSNPLLWLGIAAVAGVGYYAYTQMQDEGSMLMLPPRL